MAYTAFNSTEISVGKAIKQELWQKTKDNFADHETRISALVEGSKKVEVFNSDVRIGTYATSVTGILYHEVLQNMDLVEATVQIFNKNGVSSGTLEIDIKRNSNPDNSGMVSVFSVRPRVNYAAVSDYAKGAGTFNSNQTLTKGQILRLDITSLPVGVGYFRFTLIGEL